MMTKIWTGCLDAVQQMDVRSVIDLVVKEVIKGGETG